MMTEGADDFKWFVSDQIEEKRKQKVENVVETKLFNSKGRRRKVAEKVLAQNKNKNGKLILRLSKRVVALQITSL